MRVRQGVLRLGLLGVGMGVMAVRAVSAQDGLPAPPQGPLTLEAVLELAEARSEAMTAARAGITRADAERLRARSGLYPQVTGTASYDRALASEFEGVFDTSPGPACSPFQLDPAASVETRLAELERAVDCGAVGGGFFGGGPQDAGDGGFEDLPFGRENTWRATVAFSQNVYSGGRISAQTALAAVARESAELTVTTTRGQLLFDVTQAYYDAVLNARLLAIAEGSLSQAEATLRQVQAGLEAGTQPEFEVLRARVSRDNQTPVVIRQRVNLEMTMLRLKQLLDLPATFDLRLTETLEDAALPPPPVFAPRVAAVEREITSAGSMTSIIAQGLSAPTPRRAAVDAALADVRQSEASLDLTEAQKRPSVSLNTTYSRISYPSGVFSFSNWRTNWTIGAVVEVPILTGGRQRGDELSGRAQVDERRARLQQAQELADLESRLAWAELLAARATWEASAGTVEQAARAYQIADVRYQAGVSTQLELSDARLLLQQAEATRAQAARDVQVARARVALLPDLPLGQSTTGSGSGTPARQPQAPAAPAAPVTPQQPRLPGTFQTVSTTTQAQAGR